MKKLITLFNLLTLCSFAGAYTFDSEVPKDVQEQIVTDLSFMGSIRGVQVSPLHDKIFGKMDGQYKNFFESRVTAVGMSTCGNGNAVACVIPLFGPSKIWLTKNYIKFSHPQIAKMMVVYHEARHTEGKNQFWPHAKCPTPFVDENGKEIMSLWTGAKLAGEAACDVTPLGSYGSSLIMLKNIQKYCTNCTEKVRMDAGLYADDQFKRIIDATAKEEMKKDLYTKLAIE